MSTPESDEQLVQHIARQPLEERINALLDAVNETAWEMAAEVEHTEERSR